MKRRALKALLVLGWIAAAQPPGQAADPQPYDVSFASTGDGDLDSTLEASSQLNALRDKSAISPFSLKIRARQDIDRLDTVLQSFGYYQATILIKIAGRDLDDPDLVDAMADAPADPPVKVEIAIERGPLFRLGRVEIEGALPDEARQELDLKPGIPAVASDVLAAAARLTTALQERGYALAKMEAPEVIEDPDAKTLDVTFHVEAGRLANIGEINLQGLKDVDEDFVRRRLLLKSGQPYRPSDIEKARQDLAGVGVFSAVSVRPGTAIASDGTIPVTFVFDERPKHVVGITGAYSTDLGGLFKTTWSDRNLFGGAEQLNLGAAATGLGGSDVNGLGYDFTAQFIRPDFLDRDQSLQIDAAALKQNLEAYDQTAQTAGVAVNRKLNKEWWASIGVTGERERIGQEGVTTHYLLTGIPLVLKYDSTGLGGPLQDPTHGIRAALNLTPTVSLGGGTREFLIAQISGSTYFDLSDWGLDDKGRSVLAVRGLLGSIEGASEFDLPPDQRFYGGGSATVRGFKYQSIGPQFADHNPIGGTAIDAASLEYRQRLYEDWGLATFIDGGQVNAGHLPFQGDFRVGFGLGPRYYTSIGVVRLDIAVPLNKPPGGDTFELYIGLGQAF
ncbi:MAG TPA: BamA/TamA family outer membrane protein [Magnetospirillaceae bacterium]|nr:BamA/TamA family outer membrane protein [Magnetospirillaceae bacterium]